MRLSSLFTLFGTFTAAAAVSLVSAYFSVGMIETASKADVLNELDREGLTWAEVDTNGLQVFLIGTAPDEAKRFQALSTAGRVVDAARVIDQMLIEEPEEFAPPHFSAEIMRNDAGISVIGLIPSSTDREDLLTQFREIAGETQVSDLLDVADYPAPEGWEAALRYAIGALRDLPRSQISVDAERISVKAMTESLESKQRLESALARRKPDDLKLALTLTAPRPVITPFALRFVIEEGKPRLDACSADSEEDRTRILRAAARAGLEGKSSCTLGLGVPSRRWADAAELAIGKLAELGGGSVTFSNADISLIALEGTDQSLFDRVVGDLEAALPEVFVLHATLPQPPEEKDEGTPEFVATLSPEGRVQLRGRLPSEIARTTVESFAKARFGSEQVYMAARIVEDLPADWQVRTLAALEVLSQLVNGAVTVSPDQVIVVGVTGNSDANAEIARLLTGKLGEEAKLDIDVEYQKKYDESLGIPKPEECVAQITEIIGDRKLSFEPGSATLDAAAKGILDDLSLWLKKCGEIAIEIGGHTDSQGRESMNQELSQSRAQSVLDALRTRLVPTTAYTVKGYGEAEPIADNGTEDGREANRRIEFKLVADAADDPETVDSAAEAEQTDAVSVTDTPAEGAEPEEGSGDE